MTRPSDSAIAQASICWRCWPAFCRCQTSKDEIEIVKSERYLLDRELHRENRRAREFSAALLELASAVITACSARLSDGGEDNLPADMAGLMSLAKEKMEIASEPRNEDTVSRLFAALSNGESKMSTPADDSARMDALDAERYRWLRDLLMTDDSAAFALLMAWPSPGNSDEFDSAIDAARERGDG